MATRGIEPAADFPGYFISRDGEIFSVLGPNSTTTSMHRLKLFTNRNGYKTTTLSVRGKKKLVQAHRLVALAYIPNPEDKPFVNHLNGNSSDNRVENLEWCTAKENSVHARDVLKRQFNNFGSKNSAAKLTEQQVVEIRKLKGRLSTYKLGKLFGVDQSAIWRIQAGQARTRG